MAKPLGGGTKLAKKLPRRAATSHPSHARRARCWARGQLKKQRLREANERAAAANRHLRAAGEPTPWEQAKQARHERRHP